MLRLSIIGAGNLGKTIAKVLHDAELCEIGQILNRSNQSAENAIGFIGGGEPVEKMCDLNLSGVDLLMVSTSDNAIEKCVEELAASVKPTESFIAFHCSGALPSTILNPLRSLGAHIASIHPIKTFSDPQTAAASFCGTYCGIEGDEDAKQVLRDLFSQTGCELFEVDAENKTLYHAAIVFMCNYLYTIIDAGLKCYAAAGVERSSIIKAVEPILHETVQNALSMGPAQALTGPIARGDYLVVQKQLEALAKNDPNLSELYRVLGKNTIALAREKGVANETDLNRIEGMLSGPND